jgi:hypothetical protein
MFAPTIGSDRRPPATNDSQASWRATVLVALAAAALFATTVTSFDARVTDLAARRVLDGQIPYRDFWSMYAPGSYTVLAAAFAIFGRELIVSNILGVLVSAASVAAYHRVVMRVAPPGFATIPALVVAVAFWGANYHSGFTSYPPVSLLIWLAAISVERFTRSGRPRDLVAIGACLSVAVLFKHDVAAYACLAAAAALLMTPVSPLSHRVRAVAVIAAMVAGVAGLAVALLVRVGAGPDMLEDLIRFPLTDFRHVRPEYFPLFPHVKGSAFEMVRELLAWALCNLPSYAAAVGVFALWKHRRALDRGRLSLVVFSLTAFPLFWSAAHVQLNTHVITLTALGTLLGVSGLFASPVSPVRVRHFTPLMIAIATAWGAVHVAESGAKFALSLAQGREWVGLPHLGGIAVPPANAGWMRGLAAAMREIEPPGAPLLMLANRNDVVVFAEGVPYWLSDRPMATRHHELHPGVTDTEPVQRRMVADLQRGRLPVLVREHRFDDNVLESIKAQFLEHVPVGAHLLDEWVAQRYGSMRWFGSYELMGPRPRPYTTVGVTKGCLRDDIASVVVGRSSKSRDKSR